MSNTPREKEITLVIQEKDIGLLQKLFYLTIPDEEAERVERVLLDPPVSAILIKVSGDGLEVELGFWINDPENGRGGVISDVNKAICRVLQQQALVLEPSHFAVTMRKGSNSQ